MGYTFTGRYNRGAPRDTSYTFTIKAKDENGNYSKPTSITVEHPGIQQLVLENQDVKGLIASIKINLPKAFSETSQTVYPYDVTSEEKDILGYRLFIQEVDDNNNPVGIEEIINYDIEELEDRIIYYQAETGKRFKVRVGAYDSVYHYNWNPFLFEQTISEPIYVETFKIRFIDIDESLISPNNLTETLRNPGVPVYELEDKYTWIVGKNVDGEDIIGGIGLEVNEAEKKVDVQFVADSFRLFPTDENGDIIEGEDKAVFAVDTTAEGSTIFMDANQIGIRASKDDGSGEYNFFVLDGEGLEIFTENFKLDKNGNALFSGEIKSEKFSLNSDIVKINNNGITVTGDGFYSKLDDQGLYLYKEGEDKPYWYTNRVARGVAQSGDYIELNWDRTPKVLTSINTLTGYNSNYSNTEQIYKCYTKDETKNGFKVYGQSIIPKNVYRNNLNLSLEGSWIEDGIKGRGWYLEWSNSTNVTDLKIYLRFKNTIVFQLYYIGQNLNNEPNSNTMFYSFDNYIDQWKYITASVNNLPPDKYRIYLFARPFPLLHMYFYIEWIEFTHNETIIDNGEISWIAIEGGLDN
ncbi:hypothetical protein [Halocella sp. SP3-1]|uniref:hypothetical protein n=1 Tax=Halocella sp. SP3-1 TaxID=2382161 RepID=UPI000F759797|nr:hypothetical protein [Halocella sp. SP3-1]AZO93556.1 hypothetical protein D7D81_02500 [Halocella sp. SP3-1]